MEKLLDARIAVITGGASGIGRATAEVFLREGARVAVFDCMPMLPEESLYSYLVDVRSKESIEQALGDIETKIGRVDILVNNAGVNPEEPYTQGKHLKIMLHMMFPSMA